MLDTPAPVPVSPPMAARIRDRSEREKLAISIVIPAYNEQGAVELTIRDARAALDGLNGPWLVLGIRKSSSSMMARVTRPARWQNAAVPLSSPIRTTWIRCRHQDRNSAAQHDTIVIMDADGTYPIGNLQELLDGYRKGFDMVIGARQGKHYRESFSKSLLRLILTFLVEFTTGRDVPDVNSGFRVFSKATVTPYFHNLCDTFSFTTSLTLAYMMTARRDRAAVGYDAVLRSLGRLDGDQYRQHHHQGRFGFQPRYCGHWISSRNRGSSRNNTCN